MRSDSGWHQALSRELRDAWPARPRRLPGRRDARCRTRPVPAKPGHAGQAGREMRGSCSAATRTLRRPVTPGRTTSGSASAAPATTCGPSAAAGSGSPTWTGTAPCHRSCGATCWTAPTTRPRAGRPRAPRSGSRSSRSCSPPRRSSAAGTSPPRLPGSTCSRSATAATPSRSRRTWPTGPAPLAHDLDAIASGPGRSGRCHLGGSAGRGRADGQEGVRPPRVTPGRLDGPPAPRRAARPPGQRLRAGPAAARRRPACTWSAWSARARARCATSSPTGS